MEVIIKDKIVLIDLEDHDLINKYTWYIASNGYVVAGIYSKDKRRIILLHREILNLSNSNRNIMVDHINHNKLDNRRENLRICSNAQNCANRLPLNKSSKYLGVSIHKTRNKKTNKMYYRWSADITKNYVHYHIGLFSTEIEAAKAYNDKAIELHKEFAKLNNV